MNKKIIRIIILEDNLADAELIQFELNEAGIDFISKVVTTEQDFIQELREFSPDIILSDYNFPQYNAKLALVEAKKNLPNVPFILVTGGITENCAKEIMSSGANDCVMKNKLQHELGHAIRKALAESYNSKEQRTLD